MDTAMYVQKQVKSTIVNTMHVYCGFFRLDGRAFYKTEYDYKSVYGTVAVYNMCMGCLKSLQGCKTLEKLAS